MKHNNKQIFETYCPLFPGFYGTVFEYSGEESDIEYYNEENGTDLKWDDFNWDYAEYHKRVAKSFVNRCERELNYLLPVKMEFEELVSPKEYNFSNDSINVTVELNLGQLLGIIKERLSEAREYFKARYTSCSGFISFHSPHIEDWLKMSYILQDPKHRVGSLLECLAQMEITDDDVTYWADGEQYIDFYPKEITA